MVARACAPPDQIALELSASLGQSQAVEIQASAFARPTNGVTAMRSRFAAKTGVGADSVRAELRSRAQYE